MATTNYPVQVPSSLTQTSTQMQDKGYLLFNRDTKICLQQDTDTAIYIQWLLFWQDTVLHNWWSQSWKNHNQIQIQTTKLLQG
jgi:hypothetical protein